MGRKGISLSLSYVVLGLILIATALTVIMYFTGNMDLISQITQGNLGESKKDIAQQQCLLDKPQACQEYSSGSTDWANDVQYNGKDCSYWWNNYGESVPRCE
ncbi:MAG: hypothetical protein ABEI07_00900 [Candidatus Nanohaloarchaea archaeon]